MNEQNVNSNLHLIKQCDLKKSKQIINIGKVDVEKDIYRLRRMYNISKDNYDLKMIEPHFKNDLRFDVISGTLHLYSPNFSILSRGRQGPATSIVAIATSYIIPPENWNEATINQVLKDGNTYYTDSYQSSKIHNRDDFFITDLQTRLKIQKNKIVNITLGEVEFAGNFQSKDPRSMSLIEALELFFKSQNVCILTSSVLNIAFWRRDKNYFVFDGQPRNDCCRISHKTKQAELVSAKFVKNLNLKQVVYFILKLCNCQNEFFSLRSIFIKNIEDYLKGLDYPEEIKLESTPDGFVVVSELRAILKASFHLKTSAILESLRDKSSLILAVACLVYSHLVDPNRWSKSLLDLVFNLSNVYLMDFVISQNKKFDDSFEINIQDLLSDFILGVYSAKIKVHENVISNHNTHLEDNIRSFFENNSSGIIEIKKQYYAIWMFNHKYYFFDPLACDEQGYRLHLEDVEETKINEIGKSVVFMTSSIKELTNVLIRNLDINEKDNFALHGISVLYIKTGNLDDFFVDDVIFRAKNTHRRLEPIEVALPLKSGKDLEETEKKNIIKKILLVTHITEGVQDTALKFSEEMKDAKVFLLKQEGDAKTRFGHDYEIVNKDSFILYGTYNCNDEKFAKKYRGLQGVVVSVISLIASRLKAVTDWSKSDINNVIDIGHSTFEEIIKQVKDDSSEDGLSLDTSTLPGKITYLTSKVTLTTESYFDVNSTVNLEEFKTALDSYFESYSEMILENSDKFFAVFKTQNLFMLFNSYGFNQNTSVPATLFVTHNLKELMDTIKNTVDETDSVFHVIQIVSITEQSKPSESSDQNFQVLTDVKPKSISFDQEKSNQDLQVLTALKPKENFPERFKLFLISCNQNVDKVVGKSLEDTSYDKFKFSKPHLFSEKRILCTLLEAKHASKSVQSLLSRFSTDSSIPAKEKSDETIEKEEVDKLKLIKLPPNIYFYSENLLLNNNLMGTMHGFFIKKDDFEDNKEIEQESEEMFKDTAIEEVKSLIVPLGPSIRTPVRKKSCRSSMKHKSNSLDEKYDVILKMIFRNQNEIKMKNEETSSQPLETPAKRELDSELIKNDELLETLYSLIKEKINICDKYQETNNESVQIIKGSICFNARLSSDIYHYKPCFFSSIIIILLKSLVKMEKRFSHCLLDFCILQAEKYYRQCGKLQYKEYRRIFNLEVLNTKFNIIIEKNLQLNTNISEVNKLDINLTNFLKSNKSGVIVFPNIAYAFWYGKNCSYYLFDSYGCDENGNVKANGECALTVHKNKKSMIDLMIANTGEANLKPYCIYKIEIFHMSKIFRKESKICQENKKKLCQENKKKIGQERNKKICQENKKKIRQENELEEYEQSSSEEFSDSSQDYSSLPGSNDAILDAPGCNDTKNLMSSIQLLQKRKIREATADSFDVYKKIKVPLDLCIMAWSQKNDPVKWNTETLKTLHEVSKSSDICEIANKFFDTENFVNTVSEFNIDNYCFRLAFASQFYKPDNWNLKLCLKHIFEKEHFNGAIVILGDSHHFGVMKTKSKFLAWEEMRETPNLGIITCDSTDELVNKINQEIATKSENFKVKPVYVSYKESIDWISDLQDRNFNPYLFFQKTTPNKFPVFIFGTKKLKHQNINKEPKMKKCYFVAVLAILLKRDITSNSCEGIIDKIIELAEFIFKKISNPNHYSDLILHKIPVFNRIFDIRDEASQLVKFDHSTNIFSIILKHIKHFLTNSSGGIIQFTNYCYAFWYSKSKDNYFYLDPYGSAKCEKKTSCLGVFSTLKKMVQHMCLKMTSKTTGFFIHHLHINSVNAVLIQDASEDPIWTYLDYHWKYNEVASQKCEILQAERQKWKFYTIEIEKCVYSLWSSLGTFSCSFGEMAGKNKAAICIAILASRDLIKEDYWSSKFLDFCIGQGHKYYIESQKKKWDNRFGLQPCWTIPPYFAWDFHFESAVFGKLYDHIGKRSLRYVLCDWLTDNLQVQMAILECAEITLGLLKSSKVFYIINPCSFDLPVFPKNKGATFILRCQNFYAFLYCLTKSINSQQQFQFCLTPMNTSFYKSMNYDGISCLGLLKFLNHSQRPLGTIKNNNVHFHQVVLSESDSLNCFEVNLSLGLKEMSTQNSKIESCSRDNFQPTSYAGRIKYEFPRLIEFLEGQVTNSRIAKKPDTDSKQSFTSLSDKEFKSFTDNWKKKLYVKHFKEVKEKSDGAILQNNNICNF